MINLVKKADCTGVPVTFTINNQGGHKTFIGGCATLIVTLFMFSFVVSEFWTLFFDYKFVD